MSRSLDEWLAYQQTIHPRGIEMGLERVHEVWQRMGVPRPAPVVITVGGTNGKGSTVAFLGSMLGAGDMRVGTYTSPHILRYNERVRIAGVEVEDAALVAAFERVEAARREITLTYFEFGTLAAFDILARAGLEVALLEVGLGGRLDAVNIIDADCAIVVTVDLDHMEYLGPDREAIGREKAGIFRAGRPAIVGEPDPPRSLVAHAQAIGAHLEMLDRDFGWSSRDGAHAWWHSGATPARDCVRATTNRVVHGDLALEGDFQYPNAAAAIAALHALGGRVRWDIHAIERGHCEHGSSGAPLLSGRLQHLASNPDVIVDVGHNPQAVRELARWLDRHPVAGATRAVFGALADKDVESVVAALGARIHRWYLAGLEGESPRGEPVARLYERVRGALPDASIAGYADVAGAMAAARADASSVDRVLAFGSFHVVAPVLRGFGRV